MANQDMSVVIENELEYKLLSIVRNFLLKLEKDRAVMSLQIDADLDRDLGIDSLGKVELFHEIERELKIYLSEELLGQAHTVRDLLDYLKTTKTEFHLSKESKQEILSKVFKSPDGFKTIIDALKHHYLSHPNRPHIYFRDEMGNEQVIRYQSLYEKSMQMAGALQKLGVKPLDTIAIMLPTCEDFFYTFLGIQILGAIPVPIYPPFRSDQIEEYALREARILNKAHVRFLITFDKAEKLSKLLKVFIPSLHQVVTTDHLKEMEHEVPSYQLQEDNPALIQFTSGSTSDPKGVLLLHKNLLANVRAIGEAIEIQSDDVVVSWLPLYHDMGLIGCWLGSLYHACPIVIMSPMTFLTRPETWLWAIHTHRATISAAPNFAYELCNRRIDDKALEGLDLSSWRLTFNGAEAIHAKTLREFGARYKKYGYKEETMFPVFGLAESSVALCFPPPHRKTIVDKICKESFEVQKIAKVATGREPFIEFVACGQAIPKHSLKIVDNDFNDVDSRKIGHLVFKGPSTMQGYFEDEDATQRVFKDGWCYTGDLAYIADNELYITGRDKDIIIKAGRNLHPDAIEEVTSHIDGVRKGCVVAFGCFDKKQGTERLVVVAETRETNKQALEGIINAIMDKVLSTLGIPPDEVVMVPPQTVPKTSSGKLQRSACKLMYTEGKLTSKRSPMWFQIAKLAIKAAQLKINKALKITLQIPYSAYAYLCFAIAFPLIMASIIILPRKLGWHASRFISRALFLATFCRLEIKGKEIPEIKNGLMIVSNHTSYLDSPALYTTLKLPFQFVGKRAISKIPIAKSIIKKQRHLMVDRLDPSKNREDTKPIIEALNANSTVLLFPEGTFTHRKGVAQFKTGAFKLAATTNTAILPVAIKGARSILAADKFLLWPGKITIEIGDAINPTEDSWDEVAKLLNQSREQISKMSNEPKLN